MIIICRPKLGAKTFESTVRSLRTGKVISTKQSIGIDQKEFNLQSVCIMRDSRVCINVCATNIEERSTRGKSFLSFRNCCSRQLTKLNQAKAPIHCREMPEGAFQRVHICYQRSDGQPCNRAKLLSEVEDLTTRELAQTASKSGE